MWKWALCLVTFLQKMEITVSSIGKQLDPKQRSLMITLHLETINKSFYWENLRHCLEQGSRDGFGPLSSDSRLRPLYRNFDRPLSESALETDETGSRERATFIGNQLNCKWDSAGLVWPSRWTTHANIILLQHFITRASKKTIDWYKKTKLNFIWLISIHPASRVYVIEWQVGLPASDRLRIKILFRIKINSRSEIFWFFVKTLKILKFSMQRKCKRFITWSADKTAVACRFTRFLCHIVI